MAADGPRPLTVAGRRSLAEHPLVGMRILAQKTG